MQIFHHEKSILLINDSHHSSWSNLCIHTQIQTNKQIEHINTELLWTNTIIKINNIMKIRMIVKEKQEKETYRGNCSMATHFNIFHFSWINTFTIIFVPSFWAQPSCLFPFLCRIHWPLLDLAPQHNSSVEKNKKELKAQNLKNGCKP